jgi:hypothetical protein
VIDVPLSVWEKAVKEAERWMRAEQKNPMNRRETERTWYIYMSVALGAAMNLPAGVFGDVVNGGPENPHLTRLKNVRVIADE